MRRRIIALASLAGVTASSALAGAPSDRVTLVGTFPDYGYASDVWGYAADGVELAIVGVVEGTTIVDVTDPAAPVERLFVPGSPSSHRDLKTVGSFAYLVDDNPGGTGLQIVDFADPTDPVLVRTDTDLFTSAHNVFVDAPSGRAYATDTSETPGFQILDVTDPVFPVEIGRFDAFYCHDVYARDDIVYTASAHGVAVIDARDPADLVYLAWIPYDPRPVVTHTTWLTDDGATLLVMDEWIGAPLRTFDVRDLADVRPLDVYENPDDGFTSAHNVMVVGDVAYASWYTEGLQIFDLSDPSTLDRVGYYDTFPGTGVYFNGAWGIYAGAPSGRLYVSDMTSGLLVFEWDSPLGRVEASVTSAGSGESVEGVTLRAIEAGKTTVTDGDGSAHLNLRAGTATFALTAYGFDPDTVTVAVVEDAVIPLSRALTPRPLVAFTTTLRDGGGAPIAGAEVALSGTPRAGVTGSDGALTIADVEAGSVLIDVDAPGFTPRLVEADATAPLDLVLEPARFFDDLEVDRGWTVGAADDDATAGLWVRAEPVASGVGSIQPGSDRSLTGTRALVTANAPGDAWFDVGDVDGGTTTVTSPPLDLTGVSTPRLRYHRWLSTRADWISSHPSAGDGLRVEASDDDGVTWTVVDSTAIALGGWVRRDVPLTGVAPTASVRIRFRAVDGGSESIVEALVDDVTVYEGDAILDAGTGPADDGGPGAAPSPVRVHPNPFRTSVVLTFPVATLEAEVFNAAGRRLRRLEPGRGIAEGTAPGSGVERLAWDGTDADGRDLPPGVYYLRWRTPRGHGTERLVRLR